MVHKNLLRRIAVLLAVLCLLGAVQVSASADTLSVERQIFDYLTEEMGFNTAAACGILANIEHESAFKPTIIGDNGTSYGLCQWHNERWTALRTYCGALGLDYRTVEGQLEYLRYELGNNYSALYLGLMSVENSPEGAYRAAYLWCIQFERPSNMEVKAANRGVLARGKYWSRYNSIQSIIMVEPEIVVTEPSAEAVLEYMKQNPVTIPVPPAQSEQSASAQYVAQKPELIVYTPWHLPVVEPEQKLAWHLPALGATVAAMVIVWFFPEKKKSGKVYRRGKNVV